MVLQGFFPGYHSEGCFPKTKNMNMDIHMFLFEHGRPADLGIYDLFVPRFPLDVFKFTIW